MFRQLYKYIYIYISAGPLGATRLRSEGCSPESRSPKALQSLSFCLGCLLQLFVSRANKRVINPIRTEFPQPGFVSRANKRVINPIRTEFPQPWDLLRILLKIDFQKGCPKDAQEHPKTSQSDPKFMKNRARRPPDPASHAF